MQSRVKSKKFSLLFCYLPQSAQEEVNNHWVLDDWKQCKLSIVKSPLLGILEQVIFLLRWKGKNFWLPLLAVLTSALLQDSNTVVSYPCSTLGSLQVQNYFVDLGLHRPCTRNTRLFIGLYAMCSKGRKKRSKKSSQAGDGTVTTHKQ